MEKLSFICLYCMLSFCDGVQVSLHLSESLSVTADEHMMMRLLLIYIYMTDVQKQ